MANTVLKIEGVSKQYRLGMIGTGTLNHDINRWWYRIRGKEDPYLKIGEVNDRAIEGGDYVWALRDINLEIKEGDVIGVIGKNGSGKSTLLKLLSRVTGPTTGSIKAKGRMASLLEVGTGFHPELTGRENVYLNGAILGMTRREIDAKFDEIVDFSECAKYIDTPVKRYSSGMKVRLGFAVASFLDPEILIVDEVLAVGDADFRRKSIAKMRSIANDGKTVLFVSHNMLSVKTLCQRAIWLDKGSVKMDDDTDVVVSKYLKSSSTEITSFGEVPRNVNRYQVLKDQLFVSAIRAYDSQEQPNNQFKFQESIRLEIEIDAVESIDEVIVSAMFMEENLDYVSYSSSKDSEQLYKLEKGKNTFSITIQQSLVPADYSIGVSIMSPSRKVYDSLKYFGSLTILPYTTNDDRYFWPKPMGTVNFPSQFQKL